MKRRRSSSPWRDFILEISLVHCIPYQFARKQEFGPRGFSCVQRIVEPFFRADAAERESK